MDKNNVSLAGEHYGMAQLLEHGFVCAMTQGNAKSVDILATNPITENMYRVEVKTTKSGYKRFKRGIMHSVFGGDRHYEWSMRTEDKLIVANNLIYCF